MLRDQWSPMFQRGLCGALMVLAIAACNADDPNGPGDLDGALIDISAPLVNGQPRTVIGVGDVVQLNAVVRDEDGNQLNGVSIRWESSLETVATVAANGEVQGISGGAALIKAIVVGNDDLYGSLGIVVQGTGQAAAVVNMTPSSFTPFTTTIRVNERVAFVFPALAHNVIFQPGRAGAPQNIQQTANVIVQRQFTTAGTFPYDCTLHEGMSGEVVVRQ
jgi:plastocyanin